MDAKIEITKSFDDAKEFSKVWEKGDFEEFLKDEGNYLDRLGTITEGKGKNGESWTVTYKITLTK